MRNSSQGPKTLCVFLRARIINNEEIFDKTINSFVKTEQQSNYNVVKAPNFCKEYQDHKIQLWKIRLPNPFSNKGKSCGFRLLLVLKYENKSWFLHKIFKKTDNSEKNIQKEIEVLKKNMRYNFISSPKSKQS